MALAAAAVNRPVGRQGYLFVVQEQVAGGLGFAQEMRENFFAEVEVEINFRAPPVRMRREGIPNAAFIQRREAHDQLATGDAALMNEFVDGAFVGSGLG